MWESGNDGCIPLDSSIRPWPLVCVIFHITCREYILPYLLHVPFFLTAQQCRCATRRLFFSQIKLKYFSIVQRINLFFGSDRNGRAKHTIFMWHKIQCLASFIQRLKHGLTFVLEMVLFSFCINPDNHSHQQRRQRATGKDFGERRKAVMSSASEMYKMSVQKMWEYKRTKWKKKKKLNVTTVKLSGNWKLILGLNYN